MKHSCDAWNSTSLSTVSADRSSLVLCTSVLCSFQVYALCEIETKQILTCLSHCLTDFCYNAAECNPEQVNNVHILVTFINFSQVIDSVDRKMVMGQDAGEQIPSCSPFF